MNRLWRVPICMAVFLSGMALAAEPLSIGSRLELFVDDFVIDREERDISTGLDRDAGEIGTRPR